MCLLFVSFACAQLTGCGHSAEPKTESKPPIEKVAERGPIHLKVSIDKDHVAVAEPLRLMIEASVPENYELTMPSPGEALAALQVKSAKEPPSTIVDGVKHSRQEYELESLTSGEQTIPAMTIHYRESQAAATTQAASAPAPIEGELSSEPFTINVVSALAGDADPANLEHLRDIKGTVDVPLAHSRRWVIWASVAVFIILLGVALYLFTNNRNKKQDPPISPSAWAFGQFRMLEEDRLIEQGLYHAFYSRLSDIVRQYIERRFSLMAPERTTEEFLREVRHNPLLRDEHQRLLRNFLESADMVKFALYEPHREEAEKAFSAAREFVDETAYVAPPTNGEAIPGHDAVTILKSEIGNRKSEIEL